MNFNKFYFLFLAFVLVMASLVVATTVTTKSVSDEGALLTITGTCDLPQLDVSLQAAIGPNTIWIDQVKANNSKGFMAQFTPPQKGTYSIYAACQGEQGTSTTACVGTSSDCAIKTQDEKKAAPSGGVATPGGDGGCISQWNCTATWSVCNASLQQVRTCTDLAKCNLQKLTKVENRTCTLCEESWSCKSFSACSGGFETRKCFDDNQCGTTKKKPVEKQACTVAAPSKPVTVPPSSGGVAPSQVPEVQKPSFWGQYQSWILGITSGLLLLIVIVTVVLFVQRQKHREYNYDELKEWIRKERELGTSEEDIKKILQEHTGWKTDELEATFAELKGGSVNSGQVGEI